MSSLGGRTFNNKKVGARMIAKAEYNNDYYCFAGTKPRQDLMSEL